MGLTLRTASGTPLLTDTNILIDYFRGIEPAIEFLDTQITEIAQKGGLYYRDFGKSHGTNLADAVIAATAEQAGATLVTSNRKHFPMLRSVLVPYQKQAHGKN